MKYDNEYFDTLTMNEIHGIKRSWEDLLDVGQAIVEYIMKSDRFDLEQEMKELFIEESLDNPFAVKRIAECYKEGIGVEASDERYISELEHYADLMSDSGNIKRLAKDLYDESYNGIAMMNMTTRDWICHSEMGWACLEIGKYYSTSQQETDLCKAEGYLRTATWCHFSEAEKLYSFVQDKLRRIQDNDCDTESVEMAEHADSTELYNTANEMLRKFFLDEWGKLQEETKTYLKTALYLYLGFMGDVKGVTDVLDASCIISLMMRALEYEVGKFFYIGYSEYLLEHYPDARDYLEKNGIPEKKWKHRCFIVIMDGERLKYQYPMVKTFTLGRFNGYMGWKDEKESLEKAVMDPTFLEYCMESTTMKGGLEVNGWIRVLANGLDRARPIRNRTAHGGSVSSMTEVKEVFNLLLWVNKLLLELSKGQKR